MITPDQHAGGGGRPLRRAWGGKEGDVPGWLLWARVPLWRIVPEGKGRRLEQDTLIWARLHRCLDLPGIISDSLGAGPEL